jgi:pantothenate synthetase
MILDYNNNKKLFNYILDNDYEVILDKDYNNIMYIKHSHGEIKCKYILIFSTITSDNSILWSYENQYIDLKTRMISKLIKDNMKINDKKKINDNKIIKIIQKIISSNLTIIYEDEKINPLWVVRQKDKLNIQYFMIIDIIYL